VEQPHDPAPMTRIVEEDGSGCGFEEFIFIFIFLFFLARERWEMV
jgi:hypothetical protein